MKLTLDDYQAISGETAIYPGRGTPVGLMYAGLGLGEAGEIQGKIKKIFRDDIKRLIDIHNEQYFYDVERVQSLSKELGDILWYVSQTATELGLSLGEIAQENIDKLQDRQKRNVLSGSGDDR